MRRAGSRTADGWWLLLITVLGWLLVSFGSHHVFGGADTGQQLEIVRRQLQTVVSTDVRPISVGASPSPTSRQSPSPANVVTTSLLPTTNLSAITAGDTADSPSPSPAETAAPEATPQATSAGTPAPTVSTVAVVTARPTPSPSPTPASPSPSPTPNPVATPAVTASPLPTPTAAATVAAAAAAATPPATVAATATPSATPLPTPAPTAATVATPTAAPVPTPAATVTAPAATPAATVAATASPTPDPSPTPATPIATVATPSPTPTPTPPASLTPVPSAGSPFPSSPAVEPEPTPSPSPFPTPPYVAPPTAVSFATVASTATPIASPTPIPASISTPISTATPIPAPVPTPSPPSTPDTVSPLAPPAATDATSPAATAPPSPAATGIPTPASTAVFTPVATPSTTVYFSPFAAVNFSPVPTVVSSPVATMLLTPASAPPPAASPVAPTPTSPPVAVATPSPTASRTPGPTLAATASPTVTAPPAPTPTPTPVPTVTPTVIPTVTPIVTPTVTAAVVPVATPTPSSSPVQQSPATVNATSPSPLAAPQSVSVPATAPSLSNISADSPSTADVAPVPGTSSQNSSEGADALAPAPDATDYGNSSLTSPAASPPTDAPVSSGIQSPAPATPLPTPTPSPLTSSPTPAPSPSPPPAPAATAAAIPPTASPAAPLAAPPAASIDSASVPAVVPTVNARVPSPAVVASSTHVPSPVYSSVPVPAPSTGLDPPAAAPAASNLTQNTTAPADAPAAAPPTAAVTAPVPAAAAPSTVITTAPVPAPSQDSSVPAPGPALLPNASTPAPAPGLVAVPVPAPGVPAPAPGVSAPAPAPTSGVPVPAPAQGVPAPAPAVAVPAPAPAVAVPAPAPAVAVPAPGAAVPVPAPGASAPAVGTPSAGAPSPAALNASAPAPDSAAAGIAGSQNSNSTAGNPAVAPAPSNAAVPAPAPAASAPAVAPSMAEPELSPVSTTQIEYNDVATAPASWNTSDYGTATCQVLLTNTTVGEFDAAMQTAVMNVVHSYLVADGFAEVFYMGIVSISQYLPIGADVPGVLVNISRSAGGASPAARHLLQDLSDDGVNLTISITAPALQLHNISDLVQGVVGSAPVRRQLQEAGVGADVTSVSVVVQIEGLPPVTVPVADLTSPVAAPSPPATSNKSSSIGPIAGGIAGGVIVIVGGAGLSLFLCKRRSRRRQWTKDLEVAKASYGEEGTSNSGDSGSSGDSARPGRKVAAYIPFGTNSNESVDATPHAKHARLDDGFAGISRFKPDGTLKVRPPRQPQLISTAASGGAAPGQMGTILERKTFQTPAVQANGADLHDTANLMDSHSNHVQSPAEHAALSPTSLFSFGAPVGRNSDPFRTPGLPSRQSDGRLSSDGSANLLLRGGSGDQLLAVQASGEYSDRFQELEPIGGRKSSRQYSGNVDASLWSVAWKDLEIQKQIGEGSFGKVFLAKWRETTVAVKLLTYTGVSGSLEDNDEFVAQGMNVLLKGLEQEAGMMASMRHPNVVMYLGVCLQPPCVVTEYCARGSLNDVFKRARATPALAAQLDWGRRLNMVLDAAKGMMYLHSSEPPVIHRDLKSPNLLVDKHWRLKVCDFNLSRVMEESAILSSMAASNPRWLAPEILSGRGYTFSSDVYSFGVIMWEFLTWQIPWHECGPWQVVALVTEGAQRPELPAPADLPGTGTFAGYSEYIMLMEQCWDQDPAARPTFAQVITVLRKLLGAEMKAKASNNAELRPQSSSTPSD